MVNFVQRQRLLLFFLLAAGNLSVQASESGAEPFASTHLLDYLYRAQAANPHLKRFQAQYESALQRIPQASALPDPVLQVTHFVESVQTRTGPQENAFVLSQRVPWFGVLSQRDAAASDEASALWYAYQTQQLQVARRTALEFFEYAYTAKAIEIATENVSLLRKLEPIVEEKVASGNSTNSLLRLKIEIGKAADRLASLKQQRVSQSARLAELLALPETDLLPAPDWEAPGIVSIDPSRLLGPLKENNPELLMLEKKIASAEARRALASLQSYPDITLGISYIQTGDPVVNPSTPDAGQDPWGVSVAISIPLWFEKYGAARAEALANQRAGERELESRTNALRADLTTGAASLDDANRRMNLYGSELLELAGQVVQNSRIDYENGRATIQDLIDSERSFLELQLLHWRAAADAWQHQIVLQTLTNQPILDAFTAAQHDEK